MEKYEKSLVHLVLEAIELQETKKANAPTLYEILFTDNFKSDYKGAPNIFYPKRIRGFKKNIIVEWEKKQKEVVSTVLWRLNKEKIIQKTKKSGIFRLTSKGGVKLITLNKKEAGSKRLELPRVQYDLEKSPDRIVVIFDIPEKQQAKRKWLRNHFYNLEYKQPQESVLIGDNKIPEELLKAMGEINLLDKVHIFKIKDKGTL